SYRLPYTTLFRSSFISTASRLRSGPASTRFVGTKTSARRPTDDPPPHRGTSPRPAPDVGRSLQPGTERGARHLEPQPAGGPPVVAAGRDRQQGLGGRAGAGRCADAGRRVPAPGRLGPCGRAAGGRRGAGRTG